MITKPKLTSLVVVLAALTATARSSPAGPYDPAHYSGDPNAPFASMGQAYDAAPWQADLGCEQWPTAAGHSANCGCLTCRSWDFWASGEYLLWWGKGRNLPPLVTTSPPGTERLTPGNEPLAGALGQPTTSVLFGGEVGDDVQSGLRLDVGTWLDRCRTIGLGGEFLIVNGDSARFFANSADGGTTLARPFYNTQQGFQDAQLISFIDPTNGPFASGAVNVSSTTDIIGADAYLRFMVHRGCGFRIDMVGGYQFNRIDDALVIDTRSVTLDPGGFFPPGTTLAVQDVFDVHNEFHGGELGLLGEFHYRCWTLKTLPKVAIGNMHETVRIRGSSTVMLPNGSPFTNSGGLLARASNIGRYERNETAVVPALDITLAYQVSCRTHLSLGYSGMYWNRVAMAGDQIDLAVNRAYPTSGEQRPAFAFRGTDFWLQGVNFGLHYNY